MSGGGFTAAVASFFGAIRAGLDLCLEKVRLKNAPAMQANAAARTDQKIKDNAAATVDSGDLEKIRNAASE